MGKLVLAVASKADDMLYVHAWAESPAFSAKTSFYCTGKSLVECGKKIKGFPRTSNDKLDFSLGDGKTKADFLFKTVGNQGQCELWVRLKGSEDEQGHSAESFFPIDYLEASSIASFSMELIKAGTGHIKSAELKNKFEQ